jgi:hypothetical protein
LRARQQRAKPQEKTFKSTSPSTLANHTTIGGNTLAARNVISAATNDDVSLGDISDNQILGNVIGTDLSGKAAAIMPAHSAGVSIYQRALTK